MNPDDSAYYKPMPESEMKLGHYDPTPPDFDRLIVNKPQLTFFSMPYGFNFGCGSNALSLVSGASPEVTSAYNFDKAHYSDERMIAFMKLHGIEAFPLTIGNITNSKWTENKLTRVHLLLISQMYAKNVASWSVILNLKYIIHNFEISPFSATELIERPMLSGYILYKKEWA